MKSNSSAQKLTFLALLTALSLVIYGLESLLVPLVPIPGVKLGLANVITLIVLKRYGFREASLVLLCRILLASILFGQAIGFLYSLAGGLCCLLVMGLLHPLLGRKYLPLTSVMGAITHNLAQLLVAYFITKVPTVLTYLPLLMLSAIITGLFTGFCAHFTIGLLPGKSQQ